MSNKSGPQKRFYDGSFQLDGTKLTSLGTIVTGNGNTHFRVWVNGIYRNRPAYVKPSLLNPDNKRWLNGTQENTLTNHRQGFYN